MRPFLHFLNLRPFRKVNNVVKFLNIFSLVKYSVMTVLSVFTAM